MPHTQTSRQFKPRHSSSARNLKHNFQFYSFHFNSFLMCAFSLPKQQVLHEINERETGLVLGVNHQWESSTLGHKHLICRRRISGCWFQQELNIRGEMHQQLRFTNTCNKYKDLVIHVNFQWVALSIQSK